MARAIIRYSIDGESSNTTGNALRKSLEDAGFDRIGTGAYEADGIDPAAGLLKLAEVLATLRTPPGGGTADHVWIYFDQS